MNVPAPTEDKIDDMKDRFYEELEHVFENSHSTTLKFGRRFKCHIRDRRHFQTNNLE
jgi:hypothetical protein